MKTLFCHADILLYDTLFHVLKQAYLGVDGDTICYIGQQKPQEAYARQINMRGKLLMPGLYNLHTHTSMTLLRGVGSDLPLERWLHEAVFPVEAKLCADDIKIGTKLALMECIAGGVVSFTDMYDFPRETAQEVAAAGMKAALCRPVLALDPAEPYEKNFRVQQSIAFFEDCNNMEDGRIQVDFAIHAEYTSNSTIVKAYAEACKKHGATMHLHLSETRKEHEACKARHGKTPARYFYDLGVFENPTIAAHCVMAEPEDIELLYEKGVTAVHNPSSNMKLGSGFMPIEALRARGVQVALGTDGAASNNNLNLFEEMHLAAVIHNGYTNDPTLLNPHQILEMATINGAKAQHRARCGALAVGNKADIIALNMDAPHFKPALDIPALLTYSAQAADVCLTMVDGRILYENGEYLTIDKEKIDFELAAALKRLF